MLKALLLENVHPLTVEILSAHGYEVITRSGALDEAELIEALDGVHLLGIRSKTHVTAQVINNAPDLIAIGAFCIGTNQIDLAAAAERGVAVFNAPFSNTRSVVEMAISEMISLTRRLPERNKAMHEGTWDKTAEGSHEIRGKTLGIIGYGNIGTQLSVLAENLGMSVVFYDTAEKLALGNARRAHSLNELLESADVVTIHVDGRPGNAGLFGAEQFSMMRRGAIFLNLSRGFVMDNASLRDAIVSGHIAGAAVDVFPTEPKKRGDSFESELRGLPNVILTPHIGGSTLEAQEAIGEFVANKLRDYVRTGSTTLSVNLPNLALETTTGITRVAFLHRNTPGVLAAVNNALATHNVNIEGQLLATRGEYGYVVTDAGSTVDIEALDALKSIDQYIRIRTLPPTH
ncbi:phosphoglycerate dehydrogenase [Jonesia quinghaiensis]|uniref:phosphoglycerate dehydrogenase n=1 Tax=Jonesia quinghaiensis TaxID=262806 RepID=UPI0003F6E7A8|nr:phosphoglycerate dehydrogenase [Jonesia quinghaiensis]